MADPASPLRRSALAGLLIPGDFGAAPFNGPGILIAERGPLSVVQIEAGSDDPIAAAGEALGVAPSSVPNEATGSGRPRILGTGTGRWIVSEPESRDLAAHLRAALPESAAVTGLSHARVCLRLSGRDARTLLAKGCGIDLHPDAFQPGTSRMTSLFHASVLIDCRSAEPVYDIYVHRSYAAHLFEMLRDGALEFGCRIA
ncbi:sarcosine oxidase subunit gamma [Nisaea sediminum]|uniref:sarcosine oxidase subunit gamma n=1 Tax=Nisaea sediminum TaxID=2775867 RepID=UPI0018684C3F|nr:sarcosine oxidase subunit gamma family protein [Nisaea sediminum]